MAFGTKNYTFPVGNHMFKVDNKNTRTRCEWRRSGVFTANFEHISYLVLFLLLTLSR